MQLPKTVDPIKFAKQNVQINGALPLSSCSRLQEIADQKNNQAMIELRFGQDDSRIYFIAGEIKAVVNLICQRCNGPMVFEMDVCFSLSPVTSLERAKNLPEHYEPVFMVDEQIAVYEMIEDEILLALPMIPKHDQPESCSHQIS